MFQRLFNIAVVVLVAVVSILCLALLLTGLLSAFNPPLLSGGSGISVVAGGVSERSLRLVYLVLLLAAVIYFWRRRKSR